MLKYKDIVHCPICNHMLSEQEYHKRCTACKEYYAFKNSSNDTEECKYIGSYNITYFSDEHITYVHPNEKGQSSLASPFSYKDILFSLPGYWFNDPNLLEIIENHLLLK